MAPQKEMQRFCNSKCDSRAKNKKKELLQKFCIFVAEKCNFAAYHKNIYAPVAQWIERTPPKAMH